MPRKLKVFQASIGFFDLAVAAPSMKVATEAWGSNPDIFKQRFAKQTDDPKVVKATLAEPGVVLRRPAGSHGEFTRHASLPRVSEDEKTRRPPAAVGPSPEPGKQKRHDTRAAEAEEEARERKQERAGYERAEKERSRRIANAEAAFAKAQSRHDKALQSIKQRREKLKAEEKRENERWQEEEQAHADSLRQDDE